MPVLVQRLDHVLSLHTSPGQRLLVAFSGGLDSRVLLQLVAEARARHSFMLEAMYVHHGLSPNADHWAAFCEEECLGLNVPFHCEHVQVDRQSGLGIEASARRARYAALLARDVDYVLLAHHQDDQAETLLLQLLRGSGARGLSGMAMHDAKRRLLRPLLDVSRATLEAYASAAKLQWIEDESNLDTRYDRNFCRHEILPLLESRFPAARNTLARSAAHVAESSQLLDELAELDAVSIIVEGRIQLESFNYLSEHRARNLLRWWLASYGLPMPGTARLHEMVQQLRRVSDIALIKVKVHDTIYLRHYQGWASLSVEAWLPDTIDLYWQGESSWHLPANGTLQATQVSGMGLAMTRLQGKRLQVRYRSGGERFKPDVNRPTRTLKQLYQESNLAPWLRERLPLLYCHDELVMVPGIGVAVGWQAQANETGVLLEWQPARLTRLAGLE